jgi:hypothetical protein
MTSLSDDLGILPSSRSRIVSDQKVKTKAICSASRGRGSIDINKIVVVIERASKEPTTIVGQIVKFALLLDSKARLRGTLPNRSTMSLCKLQSTILADVNLLATRDFDFEVESVFATGEDGVGCFGAFDVGRAGCGCLVEEPEVVVVGIDGCELDWRARVDGEALEGGWGCGSCEGRAGEGQGNGGGGCGFHF